MTNSELEYLKSEYQNMTEEELEEMLSYGKEKYEFGVFDLIESVLKAKRSSRENSLEEQTLSDDGVGTENLEFIPFMQILNEAEADAISKLFDQNEISYYFEPFESLIKREGQVHSFLLVSNFDVDKAKDVITQIKF